MEYNSTRPKLVIREYGRNIQKMVEYTTTIEDRDKRNKAARAIIHIMGQLNPHLRDVADFKHKLWDHILIMSDFKLDVDSPYPIPERESFNVKPARLSYSNSREIKFRHYGKNINKMIDKICEYEDGPDKDVLVNMIANHLKKSYLTWNRDTVSDEVIAEHLSILSNGKLKLSENMKLNNTSDILARNKKKKKLIVNTNNKHNNNNQRYNNNNNNYKG